MESETYLCHEEAIQLNKIFISIDLPNIWKILDEIGLHWIYQRGQYQIINRKLWLLGKIKYGI